MKHTYTLLQLDDENINVLADHKLFESWQMLNKTAGFNIHQYKKVYEGEIESDPIQGNDILGALESLFKTFNIDHPDDYRGRSLSVSDVVVLDDVKYYCDSYGWVNIETDKKV